MKKFFAVIALLVPVIILALFRKSIGEIIKKRGDIKWLNKSWDFFDRCIEYLLKLFNSVKKSVPEKKK